jgi:uncharacterized membrane protein YgcG
MKRILLVLSFAVVMVAMVLATAATAFADAGGVPGHHTVSGACSDLANLDCFITTAGKEGNSTGGPGRSDRHITSDISDQDTDEDFINTTGTSSGGGGRCEFDNTFTKSGLDPHEVARGHNAPCPEGVFG